MNNNSKSRFIASYVDSGEHFLVRDSISDIPDMWFSNNDTLEFMSINDCVNSIGYSAFAGCCKLKKAVLPNTIRSISHSAFEGCFSLESINLPTDITEIEDKTFKCCESLKYIVIPKGVKRIGAEAFFDCFSLRAVYLPDSVEFIDALAFCGCKSLEKIEGGRGIRHINPHAFSNCTNLCEFPFGASLSTVYNLSFLSTGIKIPDDIMITCPEYLTDRAIISNGIRTIASYALKRKDCERWNEVILPDSVTNISRYAFCDIPKYVAQNENFSDEYIKSKLPNEMNMPVGYFDNCEPFDYKMAFILADTLWKDDVTDYDFINIILNHNDESAQREARKRLDRNVRENIEYMLSNIDITVSQFDNIAAYAAAYIDRLDNTDIKKIVQTAEFNNAFSAVDIIGKYRLLSEYVLPKELLDCVGKDGLEFFNSEVFMKEKTVPEIRVYWKNTENYVDDIIIKGVLYAYMKQPFDDCRRIEKIDRITEHFDSESFTAFIDSLPISYSCIYLNPVCRYGSEKKIIKTVESLRDTCEPLFDKSTGNFLLSNELLEFILQNLVSSLELSDTDFAIAERDKLSYEISVLGENEEDSEEEEEFEEEDFSDFDDEDEYFDERDYSNFDNEDEYFDERDYSDFDDEDEYFDND